MATVQMDHETGARKEAAEGAKDGVKEGATGSAKRAEETLRLVPSLDASGADADTEYFKFGSFSVARSHVLFATELSAVFMNLKCFRPGHLLVAPLRCALRFNDLTAAEHKDLIHLAKTAALFLADFYHGEDGSHARPEVRINLQDGKASGQTVSHVHFHVVPDVPLPEKGHQIPARVQQVYALCKPSKWCPLPALDAKPRSMEMRDDEVNNYRHFLNNQSRGSVTESLPTPIWV